MVGVGWLLTTSAVILPLSIYLYSRPSNMALSLAAVRTANAQISLLQKNAVVVGGTSGIGHGIALRLAKAGASVTIVGRSERGIVDEMNQLSPAGASPTHQFVTVNAYLLGSVRAAIQEITDSGIERIDYLVQTQGMATIQGFTPSEEEGLDQKLCLHVYSRWLFADQLQSLMAPSDNPRALSVLSAGVHGAYANYKEDPELSLGSYSIKNAADSAGFYNDILADSLASKYPGTTFLHAAPGFVNTRWGTEMPFVIRMLVRGMQRFGRSQEDCAEYMFRGLTNEEYTGGFRLLDQYGAATATVTALHDDAKGFVSEYMTRLLQQGRSIAVALK